MKKIYTDDELNSLEDSVISGLIEDNFYTYEKWSKSKQREFLAWTKDEYGSESETGRCNL